MLYAVSQLFREVRSVSNRTDSKWPLCSLNAKLLMQGMLLLKGNIARAININFQAMKLSSQNKELANVLHKYLASYVRDTSINARITLPGIVPLQLPNFYQNWKASTCFSEKLSNMKIP